DLKDSDFLLVPTAKDLHATPPAPVDPETDHFLCHKVTNVKGFAEVDGVQVLDQFKDGFKDLLQLPTIGVDVLKPERLCAPVNKNGEDPQAPTRPGHLVCYDTRDPHFDTARPFVNNQFGPLQVKITQYDELCVPATVDVPD